MNIQEAKNKIVLVKEKLQEMKELAYIDARLFEPDPETGMVPMEPSTAMKDYNPDLSIKLLTCWNELQKMVPSGFSIDGNLIRHLSFNEARDWHDISNYDIPREMGKIGEYEEKLVLVGYLETLRPEVSRVSEIVLNGDIDAALKTVYCSFDAKIRGLIKAKPGESTVPMIGKAFKDGLLVAPHSEHTDSIRNFLMGVMGYYRVNIVHSNLSPFRDSIVSSLSLFGLAHEAFWLLDACAKQH